MSWADIAAMYLEIELLLLASFRRNLAGHRAWEESEGFLWSAWQAEKLGNMENFRRQNKERLEPYRKVINTETKKMMKEQYWEGMKTVEREAQAVGYQTAESSFFGMNDRRFSALVKDITGKEKRAETAALRMVNDEYRQTVYKSHMSMAVGAQTLPQAVDMAAKDFLSRGITCIEYKDESRHNIADYAQMALATAATRSYLQGEARQRAQIGIDTVLVSSYEGCSNTCLPWQGRVYIDDVWGGWNGQRRGDMGLSGNGNWYSLLSVAVKQGLFHPNCRHILSTWFEGISTLPAPLDEKTVRENYRLEQIQRGKEQVVRKWKRLAEGTQDPVTKAAYKKKVQEAQKNLREFIAEHNDVLRRDYWRERTYGSAIAPAARSARRNTGKSVSYDSGADYTIRLEGYSKQVNDGMSEASRFVAQAGGTDGLEHLVLVDLDNGTHRYTESGTPGEVGNESFWKYVREHPNQHLAFIHNHNTDGFLSETDMRTVLTTKNVPVMAAVRNDGIKYVVERQRMAPSLYSYDKLYPKEIEELNQAYKSGKITAGERTHQREELLVNNLIRDYTKGVMELDGSRKLGK